MFSFYTFLLILVGGEQFFENLGVQLAVGELHAELAFELVVNFLAVEDLDFLDQTVQAEAQGGVGDIVGVRQVLERAGEEDESLDEGLILVFQMLQPGFFVGIVH